MRLSKETQATLNEIRKLEDKHGLIVFRGGLSYLMDVGHSNFDEATVNEWLAQIQAEEDAEKENGTRSFVTPDFKRAILRCSVDLAKYSVWTLFAYIKKHVVVDM